MRKVTSITARALREFKPAQVGNTTVTLEDNGDYAVMRLHGHVIAMHFRYSRQLVLSDANYRTATTKDRLNGILKEFGIPHRIAQRDFEWRMDGEPWWGTFTYNLEVYRHLVGHVHLQP